ncbi:MAG: alpha-galactosidase [Bacteroides sp.]|nr:alpha-galactosidase [Bacteroides sp.]
MNRQTWLLPLLLISFLASPLRAEEGEKFLPPLMGWSSWNTYRVDISEELIRKQADAMLSQGLKDVGYCYINVDDGFFGGRDSLGRMQVHSVRFPRGMRVVSDYIHSLGLRAGIYAEAGHNTCGSIYDDDAKGVGSGLYGHEQQDMDLYLRDWNYDFIKIDYCGALRLGLDEEKRYTTICEAIRRTGRTDVSINICRWAFPGTWAAKLARSWRISSDIRPRWSSVKGIIAKNLYLSAYAGSGHYNDMDMLEIGRGLKPNEEEVHFGLWCIMSSPLLIGCDLTTIPAASLALLKNPELIALNQDPLGLQAYVVQHEGEGYVLVKDIEKKHGRMRAVAFYNPSDTVCTFRLSAEELELGGRIQVRDLINRRTLDPIQDGLINLTLPPRSTAIWRVEGKKRLDATRYEAEWAYLPCYDALGKNDKQITYAASSACSGRMKVTRLGGRSENYAEWKEVYSHKGGTYRMNISYLCGETRNLNVFVNGEKYTLKGLTSGSDEKVAIASLTVKLQPGQNVVQMGDDYGWAPDIDMFTLEIKND